MSKGPRPVADVLSIDVEHRSVTFADNRVVSFCDLRRPELAKAFVYRYPDVDGRVLIGRRNDEIVAALEAATAPVWSDDDPSAPGDAARALADAVRALARGERGLQGSVVDETRVREIVRDSVKEAVAAIERPEPEKIVVRVSQSAGEGTHKLPSRHHKLLPEIIRIASTGANILLVGPAGSGKSTIAYQVAEALTPGRFGSISVGPTTPTSKFFGFVDASGQPRETPFSRVVTNGGVFLCDEMDNGHPGLVAELNQVLSNGHCALAWGVQKKHPDFRFIGTANTFGRGGDHQFVGRNQLDAATLDRFVTVNVPIDEGLERELALRHATPESERTIQSWVTRVLSARSLAQEMKLRVIISPVSIRLTIVTTLLTNELKWVTLGFRSTAQGSPKWYRS